MAAKPPFTPVTNVPQNVSVSSDLTPEHLTILWDAVTSAVSYRVFRGLSQNMTEVREVTIIETTVTAEAVVRGTSEVGSDTLIATDVWKILRVSPSQQGSIAPEPGGEDFLDGVDFVHIGNAVDWRTRKRQPVAGQTYFVDYVRRDVVPVLAPIVQLVDPHADFRLRTHYWYSVMAVFANGSVSERSEPATLAFVASSQPVRDFNLDLKRF